MNSERPLLDTTIINNSKNTSVSSDLIIGLLDLAYRAKRKKHASVVLMIVDDDEIAKMNRRHLGKHNPTDVLAFDDGEEEDGHIRLGDIAVSAETARREAVERHIEFDHELAFYALHGLLHLLGMRDDDHAGKMRMIRAQAKIMRDYGLVLGKGME